MTPAYDGGRLNALFERGRIFIGDFSAWLKRKKVASNYKRMRAI